MYRRNVRTYKASIAEARTQVLPDVFQVDVTTASAALYARAVICGPVVEADPNLDGWEKIWVYNGW